VEEYDSKRESFEKSERASLRSSDSNGSSASRHSDFQSPLMSDDDDFNPEIVKEKFAKELSILEKEGFFTNPCTDSVFAVNDVDSSLNTLVVAICGRTPTITQYEDATKLANSQWILTEQLRLKLYSHLFIPTEQPNWLTLNGIIRGKIHIIRELQRFMLHFVCSIENNTLPNLEFLVEDALALVRILKRHLPSSTLQTVKEWNPFHQFDHERRDGWRDLGFSGAEIDKFWESYQESLCDALFGLWHTADKKSLLDSREDRRSSVRSILCSLDLTPRDFKDVPELDSNVLDANFIVTNGPFRFKKTDYLHQHLSTQGKEILVFTEWQKLAGLRHHAVLRNRHDLCVFDILTSDGRYTPAHAINIRSFLTDLHYSVQASIFLLFFQNAEHSNTFRFSGINNSTIVKDLGIEINDRDMKDLSHAILGHSTWDTFLERTQSFRLKDPFMVPLDKLYSTLSQWKPRTFWEMRYPGYGNVDVVQLYGFYFGFMVGIAAIIALALTAAQTYTGFKSLHSN
jgi:hypothetical protein